MAVFADTSFFVAFLIAHDQHAPAAREFAATYSGIYVTTISVLTETGNYLARSRFRTQFSDTIQELRGNPAVEIVAENGELWNRALQLYAARVDKTWSFTDCLSFIVMQDRELTEALTADHHFEQAGFTILLT